MIHYIAAILLMVIEFYYLDDPNFQKLPVESINNINDDNNDNNIINNNINNVDVDAIFINQQYQIIDRPVEVCDEAYGQFVDIEL